MLSNTCRRALLKSTTFLVRQPVATTTTRLAAFSTVNAPAAVTVPVQKKQPQETDLIKAAIKQLLAEQDLKHSAAAASKESCSKAKVIVSDEALRKAAKNFENHLEEARLCIGDVHEATTVEDRLEEFNTAETAIEEAVASFVDFVDSLRHSTAEQQEQWRSVRERASHLKELRSELTDIIKQQKQAETEATTTTTTTM